MGKLKKGTYYVGDPGYIFGKSWGKVLDDTDYFNNGEIVKVFGEECAAGGTSYGDGTYIDNFGREYSVDSGIIGVLPISLIYIDKEYTIEQLQKDNDMHIIEFKEDFEVSIRNGVFDFGEIVIDTANYNTEDN